MMKLTDSVVLCMLICAAAQPADSRSGDGGDNVLPPLGHTFFCMRYPTIAHEQIQQEPRLVLSTVAGTR